MRSLIVSDGRKNMKPRAQKHHRIRGLFHRCTCVSCAVGRFAKAQRQIQAAIKRAA
jgi:hypothetical protein